MAMVALMTLAVAGFLLKYNRDSEKAAVEGKVEVGVKAH